MSPGSAPPTLRYKRCLWSMAGLFWGTDPSCIWGTSCECTTFLPTSGTRRKFFWRRVSEMVFVQYVKQASSTASLRHKFQSCLFRNDYRLGLPRKPGSLKPTSSNYLLRYFLVPLKLCILFSFIRLGTGWLYTELDYDPWFTLPPILFISLNCLEIAGLLHGN